ncbi:MAG: citramalate synthase [Clostridiales bacterium]|jgi:2-isopropylmalate synthase|nr:citramalate synthase [Clostridiales bacterium]
MTKRIDIVDSTLRDGAQAEGVQFSVEDKLAVCAVLFELGIPFIEAGNPGSNPKDAEFFLRAARAPFFPGLVAFGPTCRKFVAPEADAGLAQLLSAGTDYVSVFGKCWDLHATQVLGITLDENLDLISGTVRFLTQKGKKVFFDCEHFFDGYKANPAYALSALKCAAEAGATALVLCDTNGGAFPAEIAAAVGAVRKGLPRIQIGIHTHNDGGLAVANSLAAVAAGASQVQGTFLGLGERCGNANLSTIIPSLQLKLGYTCLPSESLPGLCEAAARVADLSNHTLSRYLPYVGTSAFTHKAGMHADGVLKVSRSFEHIEPSAVGNERRFVMSEMAGRTALLHKLSKHFPALSKDSAEVAAILARIKYMENEGYQYESADASFLLEVHKALGKYVPSFDLISYKTMSEYPGEDDLSALATVKIRVEDKTHLLAAQGDGVVNALDAALRKCLETFYPVLSAVSLVDYKVRVTSGKATASVVRVVITSTDGADTWTTVGVSPDLIRASFKALADSLEYKLLFLTK